MEYASVSPAFARLGVWHRDAASDIVHCSGSADIPFARLLLSSHLGVPGLATEVEQLHRLRMAQRKASGSQSRGRRLLEALGHREGETIGEGVGGAAAHLMQPLVVRSLHGGRLHVMAEAADAPAHAAPAGSASSVLLLRNLVSQGPPPADLAGDIVSYSASFGAVHAVRVHYVADWAARGITAADAVRVFVQFDSTVSAFRAAEAMGSMTFDGRPVAVSFFPIARFESNDFFRPDDIAGVA